MNNKRSITMIADKSRYSEKVKNRKKKNILNLKSKNSTIQEYIDASQSSATKQAYASDLQHFLAYGGSVPCTPKRLVKYLASLANDGLAVATLERRVVAIHKAHVQQKYQSPAQSEIVKQVMRGIRRTLGAKQRQVKPLKRSDLLVALNAMEGKKYSLKSARDRALLLVGFASAMRRSELVRIRMEHLSYLTNGVEIELPVSKTDQERQGRIVFIPRAIGEQCPVTALLDWLKTAGINEGYVFRAVNRHEQIASQGLSAQSVPLIVKAAMTQAGLDAKNYSGHSLRSGYCTCAAEAGLHLWQIREQTGHKSNGTLLKYIRRSAQHAATSLL